MSEPFLAEIRMVGFNFAPRGWAFCDGQILSINQNQSLYSLLGTTYGGDGRTSFALPDLRGRTPIHVDGGHALGQKGGFETVTLTSAEIPSHTHRFHCSSNTSANNRPQSQYTSAVTTEEIYEPLGSNQSSLVSFNPNALANTGSSQGHYNMQPFLSVYFCIAMRGLFPSRN